jgi:hypothetical protein
MAPATLGKSEFWILAFPIIATILLFALSFTSLVQYETGRLVVPDSHADEYEELTKGLIDLDQVFGLPAVSSTRPRTELTTSDIHPPNQSELGYSVLNRYGIASYLDPSVRSNLAYKLDNWDANLTINESFIALSNSQLTDKPAPQQQLILDEVIQAYVARYNEMFLRVTQLEAQKIPEARYKTWWLISLVIGLLASALLLLRAFPGFRSDGYRTLKQSAALLQGLDPFKVESNSGTTDQEPSSSQRRDEEIAEAKHKAAVAAAHAEAKEQEARARAAESSHKPQPERKSHTTEELAAQYKRDFDRAVAEIRAGSYPEETEARLIRQAEEQFEKRLNKLYEQRG